MPRVEMPLAQSHSPKSGLNLSQSLSLNRVRRDPATGRPPNPYGPWQRNGHDGFCLSRAHPNDAAGTRDDAANFAYRDSVL